MLMSIRPCMEKTTQVILENNDKEQTLVWSLKEQIQFIHFVLLFENLCTVTFHLTRSSSKSPQTKARIF